MAESLVNRVRAQQHVHENPKTFAYKTAAPKVERKSLLLLTQRIFSAFYSGKSRNKASAREISLLFVDLRFGHHVYEDVQSALIQHLCARSISLSHKFHFIRTVFLFCETWKFAFLRVFLSRAICNHLTHHSNNSRPLRRLLRPGGVKSQRKKSFIIRVTSLSCRSSVICLVYHKTSAHTVLRRMNPEQKKVKLVKFPFQISEAWEEEKENGLTEMIVWSSFVAPFGERSVVFLLTHHRRHRRRCSHKCLVWTRFTLAIPTVDSLTLRQTAIFGATSKHNVFVLFFDGRSIFRIKKKKSVVISLLFVTFPAQATRARSHMLK